MSLTLRIILPQEKTIFGLSLLHSVNDLKPRFPIYAKVASEGAGEKTQYEHESDCRVMGTVGFYRHGQDFLCCPTGAAY